MSDDDRRRFDENTRLLQERIDYHSAKLREIDPEYKTPRTYEEHLEGKRRLEAIRRGEQP